jgi:FAD/FMN-containing dehydrogenase
VHGGIQINMRKLNSLQLNSDGKTATVGGGVIQHEITEWLFKYGKQAGEHETPYPHAGMAIPVAPY